MAQEIPQMHETKQADEVQDRGIPDFLEKKEEENKPRDELSVDEFAKEHVNKSEEMEEEAEEHNKPSLVKKIDRSNSISSSSSDEEEGKPKQGLEEKIKNRVTGDKTEDHEVAAVEPEEKKDFMENQADEVQDRGILDFLEKKEEENKPRDELSVDEFAKEHVHKSEEMKEEAEAEAEPTLIKKLDRSNSISSSSCSDEEEGKPKQGLKEKIENKVTGGDKTEDHEAVAVEPEEKKGFMEKMKEKLPGGHKEYTAVEESAPVYYPPTIKTDIQDEETEKKGFMEKIKEKFPGHHKDAEKVE